MKSDYTLLDVRLELFDAGAASGGGDGGNSSAGGTDGDQAGTQATTGSSRRSRKSGGLDNVRYGKDPSAGGQDDSQPAGADESSDAESSDAGSETNTELTKQERRAKFRELIDTEYKDIYADEFQTAFDRRFKTARENEEALAKHQPVLDILMEKYKITDGDVDKLAAAVEKDDAHWSAAAEEAGLSVDQYRQLRTLQRDNETLKAEQSRARNEQAAQQQLQAWYAEGEAVKAEYPDFDLAAEVKNPAFLSMLRSGVPVKHAYEVSHFNDIKSGVAQQAARQTEKNVVDGIRAKGSRPAENGVSSQSGITFRSDVSKLTRRDRAEIARRVARGEEISF